LKPPEVTSSNANGNDDLSCVCMVLLSQSFTRSLGATDQNELKIGSLIAIYHWCPNFFLASIIFAGY
jgi:hypothetical protein